MGRETIKNQCIPFFLVVRAPDTPLVVIVVEKNSG
jgi:hypothetical protein